MLFSWDVIATQNMQISSGFKSTAKGAVDLWCVLISMG